MAGAGGGALWLGGCGGSSNTAKPVACDEWKQFAGTTLNFISENTAPTSAIAANLEPNAFFADLPPSLEEAAMADGASRWTAFRRIALPLVLPGIATTAVLCLVFSWNDYAFASTFSGPDSQTLPIVVAPMIVVGLVVRRWLVTGLTLGAVTGE